MTNSTKQYYKSFTSCTGFPMSKTCTYITTVCEAGDLLIRTLFVYVMLHLNKTCTIVRNNSIFNSKFINPIFSQKNSNSVKIISLLKVFQAWGIENLQSMFDKNHTPVHTQIMKNPIDCV